jgi:ribitol-5-phosphate 2-dehydrogenase (NADP+) / D-ribitol-5-phosphate cytidylyltransferase
MKQNVLILGGYGQIGSAIYEKIKNSQNVYRTNTTNLKLGYSDDYSKLSDLITEIKPSLIINCIGIFDGNDVDLQKIFNINLRPSWHIIKIVNGLSPRIKIDYCVIGSSSYKQGKKDYYLYSSSKAALVNLIQGASLAVDQETLRLNVINLPPVQSKMRAVAKKGSASQGGISQTDAADFVLGATLYRFIPGVIDYNDEKVNL